MTASNIEALPTELLLFICERLQPRDLCALRFTCKQMEHVSRASFGVKNFQEKYFAYSVQGLKRLQAITASKNLIGGLRSITLGFCHTAVPQIMPFDPDEHDQTQWYSSAIAPIASSILFYNDTHRGQEQMNLERFPIGQRLWCHDMHDRVALCTAFNAIANLGVSVNIVQCRRPPIGYGCFDYRDFDSPFESGDELGPEAVSTGHILDTILDTAIKTGVSIRSLTADSIEWSPRSDTCGTNVCMDISRIARLNRLEKIQISLACIIIDEEGSRNGTTSIERLGNLLNGLPALKSITLGFYPQVNTAIDLLEQRYNSSAGNALDGLSIPSLESLELVGADVSPIQLSEFLLRHVHLQRLRLDRIFIMNGSWKDVLTQLLQLPHLQSLSVNSPLQFQNNQFGFYEFLDGTNSCSEALLNGTEIRKMIESFTNLPDQVDSAFDTLIVDGLLGARLSSSVLALA